MEKINYSHVAYCHNNQLELLSTLGIIGFIIYYSIYAMILIRSFKNLKKERNIDNILPFIFIITLIVFEYGIVSYYRFEYIPIICLFFIMSNINRRELTERKERKKR